VALAPNSDLCLSFLRDCADYSEKVFSWCLTFDPSPASSQVGAPQDLLEQTVRLLSEATDISTENIASVKGLFSYASILVILSQTEVGTSVNCPSGPRRCKITYKKASALGQD
jgi:hypothetical protein